MKRKFADCKNIANILEKDYFNKYIETEKFKGNISLVKIKKVQNEWIVDEEKRCILANGYKWLEIYQDGANYCITAIYDNNNILKEWYIDVSNGIGIQDGIPYQDDLYLDVVIIPDGRINFLDEDELEEAYNEGVISKEQYDLAYKVAKNIIATAKDNMEKLEFFSNKYFEILNNEMNNI